MEIKTWLVIALLLSLSFNIGLLLLARYQSRRIVFFSENISDLLELITNFKNHLGSVYELEKFYGDETLEFLLSHAKSLSSLLERQYGDVSSILEPVEESEEEESEEEVNEEEISTQEKHVLYAGTRRRNN